MTCEHDTLGTDLKNSPGRDHVYLSNVNPAKNFFRIKVLHKNFRGPNFIWVNDNSVVTTKNTIETLETEI